jgi:predicted aspartyl protease
VESQTIRNMRLVGQLDDQLTALTWALVAFGMAIASAQAASFTCVQASTPDELVICVDPNLSALESMVAETYDSKRRGPLARKATEIARTALAQRHRCGANGNCITQILTSELASLNGLVEENPVNPSNSPPIAPSPSAPIGGLGETVVPLFSDGGTFRVPVTINGQLTLNFIVDSGASDVSIPADVVLTLWRTGTITAADFLGKQTYQLADGSTIPSQRFFIRSLKVGDKVLENVTGSIAPVTGSLLLGQSFLARFKSWSIDNPRQSLILN